MQVLILWRFDCTSIASFAANTNTQAAYKQFRRDLYQIRVTQDMIHSKENEMLRILRSRGRIASNQVCGGSIQDQGQLHEDNHRRPLKLCRTALLRFTAFAAITGIQIYLYTFPDSLRILLLS